MSVLRREQVVAASLVGTVVVLVGFASGLGITHPSTNQVTASGPGQSTPASQVPAGAGGGDNTGGSGGGVNYVGVAEPGGGYGSGGSGGGSGYPVVTTTNPAPTSDAPPTTTTAPGTTTSPSCQPGLVPLVVTTAVNEAGQLPLVGSLFATTTTTPGLAGIVDGLTSTLLGSCTTPPPTPTTTVTTTPGSGS